MLRLLSCAVLLCAGVQAVSFVKPCESSDRACLKESAQAALAAVAPGLPELGLESLDPMYIKNIVASQAGLDMNFRDTTVTGVKGCRIESLKRDTTKNKIKIESRCDAKFNGDYTLGGRLLILPVEGDGKYTIEVKEIVLKLSMDIEDRKDAEGKTHWHVTGWKHSYRGLGGATFDFKNLFNGNKELSDAIHTFANANWGEILKEVGPPIVRVLCERLVEAAETIFSKVPAEELAIDFN